MSTQWCAVVSTVLSMVSMEPAQLVFIVEADCCIRIPHLLSLLHYVCCLESGASNARVFSRCEAHSVQVVFSHLLKV